MIDKNSNNPLKRLLTTREVADILQISQSRVYTLVSTQRFPCVRLSVRRLRFDGDAVSEWLDARSQGEGY